MSESVVPVPQPSQLSPHRARRVELPTRYGPVAALRASAATDSLGATALLLPGFTGSKEDFAPLLDPIADAGFDVIAIDLPGQYESSGPDEEAAYHPDALGPVIAELIGKLTAEGSRVLLLGHSYGGLVARGAVLADAPIAGLTLLDSGPGELPTGVRRSALDMGEPALRQRGIEAAQWLREQMDAMSPTWDATPAVLKAFLRKRMLRTSVPSLLGMSGALRREPDRVTKLSRSLRALDAPCLVVCGENDDAWSVASQRDMAERLDADFAVVPAAKHSPNTENPADLLATLVPTWHTWVR
ncbi:MAG TPA: alpha/beta fold hydrolase [Pseudonocardiaceae bacterium]|nr:alpha/beta fold hydrolase [Pseudonocardiaceae bacterium]